jgi:cellulose synthase operon protein C
LPRVREYLDRNENLLGVRTIWLAWWHLAQAGGHADVLTLARVRDRLLHRLLSEGLNKERDLPYFLRTAGEQNSDRMRLVRDRAIKVHKLVEKWHQREGPSKRNSLESSPPGEVNKPYLALVFAFAMAKLGEVTHARDLVQVASNSLSQWTDANGVVHPAISFLFDAFSWRIENAIRGKPHEGQLPSTMLARLDMLDAVHDKVRNGAGVNSRYIVERMLHESWIINPVLGPDPYAKNRQSGTGLIRQLAETMIERDPIKISQSITNLLKTNAGADDRLRVLAAAFHLAPKVGEEFTLSLLRLIRFEFDRPLDKKAPPEHMAHRPEFQRTIVRYALFAAAHFDHADHVRDVFTLFIRLIESQSAEDRLLTVNEFAKDGIRSLRRFGFRDEIGLFLSKVSELVVQGKSFPELQRQAGLKWPELLTSMLAIAEGWLYFGNAEKAKPYLDEARATLFEPSTRGIDFEKNFLHITRLVRAYVSVIAHERPEHALDLIDELFIRLGRLPNAKTTGPYYSALHLNIVEDVVRSLISDNMSLGDQARRWLDDDEYLVRRRIHGDMRKLLKQSGL